MVEIIQVFVISLIFLAISLKMWLSHKREIKERNEYKQTSAIIERIVQSKGGNTKFYVSFSENGNSYTAQTEHYSSGAKNFNCGDEVKIGYFFTTGNRPMAVILDKRLTSVSNSIPGFCKFLTAIGVFLFLTATVMLVNFLSS